MREFEVIIEMHDLTGKTTDTNTTRRTLTTTEIREMQQAVRKINESIGSKVVILTITALPSE